MPKTHANGKRHQARTGKKEVVTDVAGCCWLEVEIEVEDAETGAVERIPHRYSLDGMEPTLDALQLVVDERKRWHENRKNNVEKAKELAARLQ